MLFDTTYAAKLILLAAEENGGTISVPYAPVNITETFGLPVERWVECGDRGYLEYREGPDKRLFDEALNFLAENGYAVVQRGGVLTVTVSNPRPPGHDTAPWEQGEVHEYGRHPLCSAMAEFLDTLELRNSPNLHFHTKIQKAPSGAFCMNARIQLYSDIVTKVQFFSKQLNLKIRKITGRKLAIAPEETIALSLFKQTVGIPTKKAIWDIFNPKESYKTLCVQMNKLALYALMILNAILKWNRKNAHPIKHTDSTDVPVCLNKNAKHSKTMSALASWGHSGKGFYYGLKMSLTSDLNRNVLAIQFASANSDDRKTFKKMNKDIMGIFVADAGYASKDLEKEFYIEHKRILFAKPRANMKKMITAFQYHLYNTRMLIELNFRNLKMLYAFITSFPRSIDGYFANYIYSILSYVLR